MRKILLFLFIVVFSCLTSMAQQLTLKKGSVLDSLEVKESNGEHFALYLPKSFDVNKKWPIVFAFDTNGHAKKAIQMFVTSAENQNYIIAAPNSINDSLSISENVIRTGRMMNYVLSILPINEQQIYTAGFSEGAKFASVLPVILKNIKGVLAVGTTMANTDVLDPKNSFHYIGLVSANNYNLLEMQLTEKILNGLRFSNQLFVYEEGSSPTSLNYIEKSLEIFTLEAMAKGVIAKDSIYINDSYKSSVEVINSLISRKKYSEADNMLSATINSYRPLIDIDELKSKQKSLSKDKVFKSMKRTESSYSFKETLLREDYDYAIYEDALTYNFNNLGWWNYQMQELKKNSASGYSLESQMGKRLIGFANNLVDSNIEELEAEHQVDEEGLGFLWMLKTITNPKDFHSYFKVISYTSKVEDYGTALFYLEELLKAGFEDSEALYSIENTALLRITPEFNLVIEKYLKDARYKVIEQ